MHCAHVVYFVALLLWVTPHHATELENCQADRLEGSLPDCNCRPQSVETAVTTFLSPLLKEITQTLVVIHR
jgi:hypothetical protein